MSRRPDLLLRIDADGQERVFTEEEIGHTLDHRPLPVFDAEGTFWSIAHPLSDTDSVIDGLVAFDGDRWTTVPLDEEIVAYALDLDVAPDGSVWMLLQPRPEAGMIAKVWDGESWTTYGPYADQVLFSGTIQFLPDGTTWLGSNILIDGSSDRQVTLPASPTNRKPEWSVAHAPDGSIWVVTEDVHRRADDRCPQPRDVIGDVRCRVTDGLYVITPEAVAATE